jgi:dTDP-4-dehydrorhamnose reductase
LNVYGRSKAEAEAAILGLDGANLVIRTAAFFSPDDQHNFAHWVARELSAGRAVRAAGDCVVTPTYVPDLVHAALDLVTDGERGIWHLSNGRALSWAEFAREIAAALELDAHRVRSTPSAKLGWAAERPRYAALGTERAVLLPSFDNALARYAHATREGLDSFQEDAGRRRNAEIETAIGCVA